MESVRIITHVCMLGCVHAFECLCVQYVRNVSVVYVSYKICRLLTGACVCWVFVDQLVVHGAEQSLSLGRS